LGLRFPLYVKKWNKTCIRHFSILMLV